MEARVVVPPAGDAVQLASMLGRAFADDPMIRWKLRADVTATEIGTTFEPLVAAHAAVGTLRQIAGGYAAAAWMSPALAARFDELARSGREAVLGFTDDAGARFDAFWDWVAERLPTDARYLDFVGVEPFHQGRGVRLGARPRRAGPRSRLRDGRLPPDGHGTERLALRATRVPDREGGRCPRRWSAHLVHAGRS